MFFCFVETAPRLIYTDLVRSIHNAGGSVFFQTVLAFLRILFGVMMIVGYHTTFATAVCNPSTILIEHTCTINQLFFSTVFFFFFLPSF